MAKKKSIRDYFAIGSMGASLVIKNLPFVLFIGFLAIIYIANAHYAEKQVRRILLLQKEVKTLKQQYNSLKSEIMFKSRMSEIGEEVEALGLRKSTGKVKKIVAGS